MSRFYINTKASLMKTGIGKAARRFKHYISYKKEDALRYVNETWPEISENEKNEIVKDMMKEARKHEVVFEEYIFHHFREKSEQERRAYIPILEGAGYCE